jgi:hypothetical protein
LVRSERQPIGLNFDFSSAEKYKSFCTSALPALSCMSATRSLNNSAMRDNLRGFSLSRAEEIRLTAQNDGYVFEERE